MFWSFDLPAMPFDAFRIVPERMFVLELLCSALTIFAWQAGIRISGLAVLKIHLLGQVTFYFDVSLREVLFQSPWLLHLWYFSLFRMVNAR